MPCFLVSPRIQMFDDIVWGAVLPHGGRHGNHNLNPGQSQLYITIGTAHLASILMRLGYTAPPTIVSTPGLSKCFKHGFPCGVSNSGNKTVCSHVMKVCDGCLILFHFFSFNWSSLPFIIRSVFLLYTHQHPPLLNRSRKLLVVWLYPSASNSYYV